MIFLVLYIYTHDTIFVEKKHFTGSIVECKIAATERSIEEIKKGAEKAHAFCITEKEKTK